MLLQIFLPEKFRFVELLLGSHIIVYNVSWKNAYLYPRGQCHTARTQCCVSVVCRFLFGVGGKKFQKSFQEISVSSCFLSAMGTVSLPSWDGNSPSSVDSLCKPNSMLHVQEGGILHNIHTCPLSHVTDGTTICCFPELLCVKGKCSYFVLLKAPKKSNGSEHTEHDYKLKSLLNSKPLAFVYGRTWDDMSICFELKRAL